MGKYDILWDYIQKNQNTSFTMSFDEIEKVAGVPIDHSFLTYKKELTEYGCRVEKISMKEKKVFFCKVGEKENELLRNIDKLHTTELGTVRIKRNLSLDTDEVVGWCKTKINSANAVITRNGKNWYINADGCVITVNAYSYTIITAHEEKR